MASILPSFISTASVFVVLACVSTPVPSADKAASIETASRERDDATLTNDNALQASSDLSAVDTYGSIYAAYLEAEYVGLEARLLPLARAGDEEAQRLLALLYYQGLGVERDVWEAFKWFKRFVEQGDAQAQLLLGTMLYFGEGVPENYVEAARWFRRAAGQGSPVAQAFLGGMYAEGEGVPQDFSESYFWMIIANAGLSVEQVDGAAAETLKDAISEVKRKLSSEQILEVQERASQWYDLHPPLSFETSAFGLRENPTPEREAQPFVRVNPSGFERCLDKDYERGKHVVDVEFDVDKDGNVLNPNVVNSTNRCFNRYAIRAVSRWKYQPEIVRGEAVQRRGVRATIHF